MTSSSRGTVRGLHLVPAGGLPGTPPPSDVDAITDVLDRLTGQPLTPKREVAVRALLDLMPELLARACGH